jgi:hypothetical protein
MEAVLGVSEILFPVVGARAHLDVYRSSVIFHQYISSR